MRLTLIGVYFAVAHVMNSESSMSTDQSKELAPLSECLPRSFSNKSFTIIIPHKKVSKPFSCQFNIKAYADDVCRLQVTFDQFQLASSKSCEEQYLQIGDKRVCGSIIGTQVFPFPGDNTAISYRGDGKYPVHIQVQQERCKLRAIARKCDVTSSEKLTQISSLNYPFPYPTPLTCLYTIKTLPQETCQVAIRFIDFNIPESTDCLKGRLLIDGEPYCGKKTGLVIFKNITHDFNFEFSEGSGQTNGVFQLSVEKEKCQNLVKNISKDQEPYFSNGVFPGGLPLCCNRPFSAPYFVLTNPGFLQTASNKINCVYQITQTSPEACRIRLNFVHFWIGQEDPYYGCVNGFLEVDGRRICGCKDGLSFATYFNSGVKELLYSMRGSPTQGFLIEVVQENCYAKSGKSLPEDVTENPDSEVEVFTTNNTLKTAKSKFLVSGDSSQCFRLDPTQWLTKIQAFTQSVKSYCPIPYQPTNPIIPPFPPAPPILQPNYPINPIIPPTATTPPILPPTFPINPIIPPPSPPVYPPTYPVNPIIPPPAPTPPVIPPTYPINPIIPPPHPPIYPPTYPINPIIPPSRPIPPFPTNPIIPPPPAFPYPPPNPSQCQILPGVQGSIQSPRYPFGYPSPLKCCYRIRQVYGYCRVQLIMLDFDVTWTPKCIKDYLLLDGRARYCGRSLQSTTSYLNFRNNYAAVDFVTSSLSAFTSSRGRGFRAVYRQLPCNYGRSSGTEEVCQPDVHFPHPSKPLPIPPNLVPSSTPSPPWQSPPYPFDDGFDLNVPAE